MLTFACVHGCREGSDGRGLLGFRGFAPGLVAWLPGEPGRVKRRGLLAWGVRRRLAALDAGG